MISLQDAIKQLNKEELAPLYTLIGTEYYFIEQFKKALFKKIGEESEAVSLFDLRETAIQDIVIDLETLPFFSERNISIAEFPVFLLASPEKVQVTHDTKPFEQYIEQPAPYSTLVLIAPYERLDRRKSITKKLLKNSVTIDCQPIRDYELRKWLDDMLKLHEIKMTEEAKLRFEAEFGPNLYLLQREVEKLSHYIESEEEVTEEIVSEIMSHSTEQTAIDLADAVLERDLERALMIFRQLEKMNEHPVSMIALLSYQFRMMLQAKIYASRGLSLRQIQSSIKAHPYVVKKAYERSQKYDRNTLYKMIDQLAMTDYEIKSGQQDEKIAFELLLYHLIYPKVNKSSYI